MHTILSIDGGGIRGVIPAVVLCELEQMIGAPLYSMFDLMAGTSTGGLITLCLSCPAPGQAGQAATARFNAADVLELYERRGKEIFSVSLAKKIQSGDGKLDEKYDYSNLEKILTEYFGATPLNAALTRVLISAYDIQKREPYFFKSWHPETGPIEMRRIGRATSAAPTYFEPALVNVAGTSRALVDGGVFVNNPAMSAYAEACRCFDGHEFQLVAIGTGISVQPIPYERARNWGLVGWARPILDVVFDGVSDAVDYQLTHILGDQYFRFQTDLVLANPDLGDASKTNIAVLKDEAARMIGRERTKMNKLKELLTVAV